MPVKINVSFGDRYGKLVIISEHSSVNGVRFVQVACDCGTTKKVRLNDMRSGGTTSCGCHRNDRVSQTCTTHGRSGTPEYRAWWDMVARCTDPSHSSYACYGGRGITIHNEWLNDFSSFLSHIGNKPSPQSTLDRRDNELGYFPGNVRWVGRTVNSRNTRLSRNWIIDGRTFESISDAAESLNIDKTTVRMWCNGWKCYRTGKMYPPKINCRSELKYGRPS